MIHKPEMDSKLRRYMAWFLGIDDAEDETEIVTREERAVTRIYSSRDFVIFLKGRNDEKID